MWCIESRFQLVYPHKISFPPSLSNRGRSRGIANDIRPQFLQRVRLCWQAQVFELMKNMGGHRYFHINFWHPDRVLFLILASIARKSFDDLHERPAVCSVYQCLKFLVRI